MSPSPAAPDEIDPLRSGRLRLRRWTEEDAEPFARMNADPRVTKYLPAPLSRRESDALMRRLIAHHADCGFGIWAIEVPGTTRFAGCVGLARPHFDAPFTPCIEVAWRLLPEHWGKGYASEGARIALDHGFSSLGLDEVLSFTVAANERSWRVMERIGMERAAELDFDHPALPDGHPLRPHVTWRITRDGWRSARTRSIV